MISNPANSNMIETRQTYIPASCLRTYIDRYWVCKIRHNANIDMFPLVAGTGVDLFIHLGTPFFLEDNQLSSSHILCPRQLHSLSSEGNIHFIAIRFRSGSFRHFSDLSFNEINNTQLSVEEVWKMDGGRLINQLQNTSVDISKCIALLDTFFIKQLQKHKKNTSNIDRAINILYTNQEEDTILSIAQNTNMSLRNFERIFKSEFGLTPKRFQNISRFQRTLRELLLSDYDNYLPLVLNNGYYDQAHFIKECKSTLRFTPTEIYKLKDSSLHFFFKKLH